MGMMLTNLIGMTPDAATVQDFTATAHRHLPYVFMLSPVISDW
jgi:hypothetical protein